jgi:hypothetical protein
LGAVAKFKKPVAGISFILLLSVLNRYFRILKWQKSSIYLKPISVSEATKVLAALTAGILHQWHRRICRKKHCIMKNQKPKKCVLNLICNGIQMVLTVIIDIWIVVF